MGWPGIVLLGAVIGLVGWRLHPSYRASRMRGFAATSIGVIAAGAAKMAGNIAGLFYDGGVLEWPVCTAVAFATVAVAVALPSRRRTPVKP
jgi:CDP-diglyceride synthetase